MEVFVPQCVNKRVQDGSDDSVEDRDSFVHGKATEGVYVDVDARRKYQGHHCDVGDAGGESLALAYSRPCSKFDQEDGVRHKQYNETHQGHQATVGHHEQLHHKGIGACQFDHLWYITVEIIQLIVTTKGQVHDDAHLHNGVDESSNPGGT